MYAPFTEETCTGTGATITLTGATANRIPFSRNFSDGQPVSYVIVDGSNIVAGRGTYNSGNTITRNDFWNDNGTTSTKYPGTNLTLSGSGMTIRCELLPFTVMGCYNNYHTRKFLSPCGTHGVTFAGFAANTIYYQEVLLDEVGNFTTLGLNVSGSAGGSARVGIYYRNPLTGSPGGLLVDSGLIDTTLTGDREVTGLDFDIFVPGRYWAAVQSDTAIDLTAGSQNELAIPLGANSGNLPAMHMTTAFTFAAFPATAQLTSLAYNTSRAFQLYME